MSEGLKPFPKFRRQTLTAILSEITNSPALETSNGKSSCLGIRDSIDATVSYVHSASYDNKSCVIICC